MFSNEVRDSADIARDILVKKIKLSDDAFRKGEERRISLSNTKSERQQREEQSNDKSHNEQNGELNSAKVDILEKDNYEKDLLRRAKEALKRHRKDD